MKRIKEFIKYVISGIPLAAVIIFATIMTVHIWNAFPPVGVAIVFICTFIIASAAIGLAKDILSGD
jgi:hypothetical protein